MSADDLEQDDLAAGEDDEPLAEADVEDEAGDADDDVETTVSVPRGKKAAKAAVAVDEMPSLEAKQKEREALDRAIQEFLARGGRVQEIGTNVLADPPKKPENKYGSRPI